jgi:hypothetical protein
MNFSSTALLNVYLLRCWYGEKLATFFNLPLSWKGLARELVLLYDGVGQPQTVFGKLTFELNAQHLGAWDLTRAKMTLLLLWTPWGSPADQRQ